MDAEDLLAKYITPSDRLADATSSSDVFTRQFGTELTGWEKALVEEFRTRLTPRRFQYKGFVRHTRAPSTILLTPSPWLLEGEIVFFPSDMEIPRDGARVEIEGRRVASPFHLQRTSEVKEAISAEDCREIPFDMADAVTPPMHLKELSALLFERVGMAEASKRVFARLFVSSPPYMDAIGGLTTGIQAIASQRQVARLLSFIKNVLPSSMRVKRPPTQIVQGLRLAPPKMWRLDAGSISSDSLRELCTERRDPSGYREVSIGALTQPDTAPLPDVPLALASEDFWIETSDAAQLRLPILKSAITYQLVSPQISAKGVEAGTQHVLDRLEGLQESFGLQDTALARGGLLDADMLGRPLSVIRIARSTARASWNEKVSSKDLKQTWDRVLEPAIKEFLEISDLKKKSEEAWGKGSRFDRFNTKVMRAIRTLDSGERGSLGPTLAEIAEEAGVQPHVAAETLTRMKESGVLYEPRPGRFRLV
jgi:hypothetical protein